MEKDEYLSLKNLRESFGIEIGEIANNIGIDEDQYRSYENNEKKPTKTFLTAFINAIKELTLSTDMHMDTADFWAYYGFYTEAISRGWSKNILSNEEVSKEYKKDLGRRLKAFREMNKMTQEDFSILFDTTQKTISHWETGRSEPPISFLANLLNAFPDLEIYDFILGEVSNTKRLESFDQFFMRESFARSTRSGIYADETDELMFFYQREKELFELMRYAPDPLLKKIKNTLAEMKKITEKF